MCLLPMSRRQSALPLTALLAAMQHHESIAGQLYGQALQGLCDDLNSPVALSTLSGPLKQLNDLIHTKKVRACISCGLEPMEKHLSGLRGFQYNALCKHHGATGSLLLLQ